MGHIPDDPAPSYEESVSSRPFSGTDSKHAPDFQPAMPLAAQLANTRTRRINAILETYVDPLLISQGVAGLYKTIFILVPSTVSSLQDAVSNAYTQPPEPQVVGFPANEVVKLIRLKGEEYAMEFWRQPAVVAELESSMKARLVSSGHRLFEPSDVPAVNPEPSPKVQETRKVGFWGKIRGRGVNDDEIEDRKLGWRAEEPQAEGSPGRIPTGLVKVSVQWKEIALRIANDMGLYESKRGPALCIVVEVGT
ncbi:uncharacterized protein CIMG_00880 [Coccidioides immitis RS]|uniref:Uncharacterized protein n=4 Tax=Coccidioides TaxID=5500 RepID=J3KHY9_COCIM|nr:uncharacterized protein CIMG_00880 [Coccidioides immitis RS]XP_003066217.1 hypothetical protein CPC735_054420 [Coccidioides posadasii C735 delta SOWgp]KMM65646.1 hypothetical protein CPAG_01992 [Coccidioides posadasii RMSCC 3488]KMU75565.1 hypothetical protein CISG_04968 [Coccidioides immitis RMSCC 3703]QVM07550.1 hypothetical protein D8B26_002248 [Coccidioides posadasii str. Silveira]TPX26222.1 hypothetical protein DIZ76_011683 [Coccidioides immitis]EAS35526.3 hypothetical protein CIMG_00|eukprot:XP_003066217.1 hypothetical protein CPC735_054420 [Coccidioides posadasii C735 delta SOWgp]